MRIRIIDNVKIRRKNEVIEIEKNFAKWSEKVAKTGQDEKNVPRDFSFIRIQGVKMLGFVSDKREKKETFFFIFPLLISDGVEAVRRLISFLSQG